MLDALALEEVLQRVVDVLRAVVRARPPHLVPGLVLQEREDLLHCCRGVTLELQRAGDGELGVVVQEGHEVVAASLGCHRHGAAQVHVHQLQGLGAAALRGWKGQPVLFPHHAGLAHTLLASRLELLSADADARHHVLGKQLGQVVVAQVPKAPVPQLRGLGDGLAQQCR